MQEKTKKKLSICERFFQVLDYYGESGYKFSKESGISEAVLSNMRQGKNPPKIDVIEVLLNKYKVIDANWLLTGQGPMLKPNVQEKVQSLVASTNKATYLQSKHNNKSEVLQENSNIVDKLLQRVESLSGENSCLKAENKRLRKRIAKLTEIAEKNTALENAPYANIA
jgi:transcriptional regulator with XRE-family HTH domain